MTVEVLFMGAPEPDVFGIYHSPAEGLDCGWGVVLCPAFGQEGIRSYRALRQLAYRFAASGLHVLRFDYRGSGESGGDPMDASFEGYVRDAQLAVSELQAGVCLKGICAFGARLGGAVAAALAGRARVVRSLVLWDAVLDGARHLEHLHAQHRRYIQTTAAAVREPSPVAEFLGFPMPPLFVQQMSTWKLGPAELAGLARLQFVNERHCLSCVELASSLACRGVDVDLQVNESAAAWEDARTTEVQGLAAPTVDRICQWLEGSGNG